ncbi:gamma-butyrobetaine,2-oxoglutarate dioxygenase [Halomonas aestuarii]|uniref:Gamma-butyrobetaine,2-oxoglutarate dioxygenase n=1 Tax=Halomonas aestuarii TaxID=1897729 RepID=A0A1J0VE46_9GAMM|nr:TauD/TfdA family dioxygenase [Halomonas aestuarii]APE30294.1 gamma-butyrobetaine,2-oxoglutarate dioxygenase [Halomonas aestuarii]
MTAIETPPTARPRLPMGELADHADAPALVEVHPGTGRLALVWEDGARAHFPLDWLRDHCACEACRHPVTRERLHRPLTPVTRLPEASLVDGNLALTWADDHRSRFDAGWLYQRRPGQAPAPTLPARRPWAAGYVPCRVVHADFTGSAAGERAWLEALLRDGLVLLEDGPLADEEVSRLAERIGPLRPTNFGARFDVRSKPNPNNAAYTAIGLALHTDLPNWRQPPDIQLLYCLENDAEGGESIFADGFAAAEALREQDPEAFRLLAETPIDFRFQDEEQDIGTRAPILSLDADGEVLEVRFNNWIRDTLRLPAPLIEAWYAAYRRFWRLLHSPEHQIDFALAPGQMVAFDNRRVLHGRRAFDPSTGRRHLQGTYLDLDMLESRLRVLARRA